MQSTITTTVATVVSRLLRSASLQYGADIVKPKSLEAELASAKQNWGCNSDSSFQAQVCSHCLLCVAASGCCLTGGARGRDFRIPTHALGPVSYTHLDVYKRQTKHRDQTIPHLKPLHSCRSSHPMRWPLIRMRTTAGYPFTEKSTM